MKKIKYLIYPILFVVGLSINSCTKENDYTKFTKDGEISYPGKAGNVIAQAGNKRIQLRIALGPDPLITKIKTYWNSRADSLETAVVRTAGDTVNIIIDKHLNEGINNFEIYTYNSKGDKSVVTNAVGNMYGDNYISALSTRSVSHLVVSATEAVTITWGAPIAGEKSIQVNYIDAAGAAKTLAVASTVAVTTIDSHKAGTDISYSSTYSPEPTAFDLMPAPAKSIKFAACNIDPSTAVYRVYGIPTNYVVVTDEWEDYAPGAVIPVTQIDATHISFFYPTSVNKQPIVIAIDPITKVTSVAKVAYGAYSSTNYSAVSVASPNNLASPCDLTISVLLNHTATVSGANQGNYTIKLRKQ